MKNVRRNFRFIDTRPFFLLSDDTETKKKKINPINNNLFICLHQNLPTTPQSVKIIEKIVVFFFSRAFTREKVCVCANLIS